VICEYLDQFTSRKFFPPAGDARWEALKLQALADGIMDAAILVRYETFLRPEEKRWPEWIEGQMRKITNSLGEIGWITLLEGNPG
jgi:glutathione S-transferase